MFISTPEAKVGLFSIIAIVVLVSLFAWLNGTASVFQDENEIEVVFSRVEGLRPGAPVKYLGVDVGRVALIYFENNEVIVNIRLTTKTNLPEKITMAITNASVVGDKHAEIRATSQERWKREDGRIIGINPATMDEIMASVNSLMISTKNILSSIESLTADESVGGSIRNSLMRIDRITASLESTVNQSQADFIAMLKNANKVAEQLNETTALANKFMKDIDANGQTAADLKASLANIKTISANLEKFSKILADNEKDIDRLIDDAHQTMQSITNATNSVNSAIQELIGTEDAATAPEEAQSTETKNVPTANSDKSASGMQNAKKSIAKMVNTVKKLEQISVSNSIGVAGTYYNNDSAENNKEFEVDYALDVKLNPKKDVRLAVEDIGRSNAATLQVGSQFNDSPVWGRGGLYKDKFGVGVDYRSSPLWRLSLDAWDVEDPNLGLTSRWKVTDSVSVEASGSTNTETNDDVFSLEFWKTW